uniref:EF-hand domain-containing protein n=1 Tax=Heterosigma akashiwo TaxID=2829 RepID=A0A7S4DFQ2_HETAK
MAWVATVGSIFGMNLHSGVEETSGMFYTVTGITLASTFVAGGILRKMINSKTTNNYKATFANSEGDQRVIEHIGSIERVLNYTFNKNEEKKGGTPADYSGVRRQELRELFRKETGHQLTDTDLDSIFRVFDLDSSGQIGLHEYRAITTKRKGQTKEYQALGGKNKKAPTIDLSLFADYKK